MPPPISGAQGRGRLAPRQISRRAETGGDGRGTDRLAVRAHTPGPAPEGASAAPGSARNWRARGLVLEAWSAYALRPPAREVGGPNPREDGVLDDLQSRGVSADHGAPEPTRGPGGCGEEQGPGGEGKARA